MTRLLKRLGKIGAAIVLLFLVAEVASRVKMYYRTGDKKFLVQFGRDAAANAGAPVQAAPPVQHFGDHDHRYYKMPPSPAQVAADGGKDDYRINSLGFRGPEFSRDKKPGVTRIFCVGDSNTIGLEAPEDVTWPATLGRVLAAHSPSQFEVINAGFAGYISFNYLMLIQQELLNYSPDVIVIYGGVNDLNHEANIQPGRHSWAGAVHDLLYNRSIFYTLAIEKISLMKNGSPVPLVTFERPGADEFAENTTRIIGLCRDRHVRLVFVREMVNDEADPDLSIRMNEEMDVLKALCAKHRVEYLDLRGTFREARQSGKRVFRDHMHLDADGYRLLADKVSDTILQSR